MPYMGVAVVVLMALVICGAGIIVAAIGRLKKSRLLVGVGLTPVGIALTLVLLAILENHLPLDWRARLHMSLPSEARVVRFESDMDKMEIVFRLPGGNADGLDAEAFQAIWKRNVGSYTYPCPDVGNSVMPEPGIACAWYERDPDGGERRLSFYARTHTYCYSAR